jgi:hypothetical protein
MGCDIWDGVRSYAYGRTEYYILLVINYCKYIQCANFYPYSFVVTVSINK